MKSRLYKRLFLTFSVCWYVCTSCIGQWQVNDTLLISGTRSGDIDDILVSDDRIFIRGSCLNDSALYWCLYFAEIDSAGAIVRYSKYCDPSNSSHYFTNSPTRFLRNEITGHFIIPGYRNADKDIILIIADSLGNIQSVNQYDNIERTIYPKEFFFWENHYYLIGDIQRLSYFTDCYIMKLDTLGHQVWMKHYGHPAYDNITFDVMLNPEGTMSVYGNETNSEDGDDLWIKPWIFEIDTSGVVVSEWKGEKNDPRGSGIGAFHRMDNGDLIITSVELKDTIVQGIELIVWNPFIARLDADYNIIWKRYPGLNSPSYDRFYDLEYDDLRNEFVAAGHRIFYYSDTYSEKQPWAVRFTPDGDILWSVGDTILSDSLHGVKHFTSGMDMASDGTVYLAGYVEHNISPARTYGWILKITPDGCIDTLCPMITSVAYPPADPVHDILLSPNPASDQLSIHVAQPQGHGIGSIFSMDGRHCLDFRVTTGDNTLPLHLPSGQYYIVFRFDTGGTAIEWLLIMQ